LRDGATLKLVGEAIRSLPLNGAGESIGDYYIALSICRDGPESHPQANQILWTVAEKAPMLFQAKACVALGSNLIVGGDIKAGLSAHDEACRIAGRCDRGALPVLFHIRLVRAFSQLAAGDRRGALGEMERLFPIASRVGLEFPALFHHYLNNRADQLAENGRLEEAQRVADKLSGYQLLDLYPEFRRTCEDIAQRTRRPSRLMVVVPESYVRSSESDILTSTAETQSADTSHRFDNSSMPSGAPTVDLTLSPAGLPDPRYEPKILAPDRPACSEKCARSG
jgi:hypothetical protein